jgi:hypothetical protein
LEKTFIRIDYLHQGTKSKEKLSLEQVSTNTFENILESMNKTFAGVLLSDNCYSLDQVLVLRKRIEYEQNIINMNYNVFQTLEFSLTNQKDCGIKIKEIMEQKNQFEQAQ